jgi:hypothetical protein
MKKIFQIILLTLIVTACNNTEKTKVYYMPDYGIYPNTAENISPLFDDFLKILHDDTSVYDRVEIVFEKGAYQFHEDGATRREYYISNHDHVNPKKVGMALDDVKNLVFNGNGSDFIFYGRMLPLSLVNSTNCKLSNFSIDFAKPQISQVEIIENRGENGIVFKPDTSVNCRINEDGMFESYGENWKLVQGLAMAFEKETHRIVYNSSDVLVNTKNVEMLTDKDSSVVYYAPLWNNGLLIPGTIVTLRTWERPAPGIFISQNKDTYIENVKVHYAEGMALLAQLCDNINIDKFYVCFKGENDPRYFTTQADATHFSGCRGKITVQNGFYEAMMDDAINVHGTYLKVIKIVDDHTLIGRYMHNQSWGFPWGEKGDKVVFVASNTMEIIGDTNIIENILPYDKPTEKGAHEFSITFKNALNDEVAEAQSVGIENIDWTPSVEFLNNVVKNNRARGALFSTPKDVLVSHNVFDHTSGSAILLCGDCNGWYETGACRNVVISDNTFINPLTNMFQFTNAVISIYPEIPDLKNQVKYFHGGNGGGVKIIGNTFEYFDKPIVYAKSLDGLLFENNTIKTTYDYKPFHFNQNYFIFERVVNVTIQNNNFDKGFDPSTDVVYREP